ILACDALRRGEPLKFDHLFAGFQHQTGRLVLLGAVSVVFGLVMLLVGALVVGLDTVASLMSGIPPQPEQLVAILMRVLLAVLVIIALSLPFYMAIWFAVPLIALRGVAVGAAMSASFAGCIKNVLPFLVWSVAVLALAIVPSLLFGIGVALKSVALALVGV